MKYYFLLIIVLAIGCKSSQNAEQKSVVRPILNREILDTNINQQVLFGLCDRSGLENSAVFSEYFKNEYSTYQADEILKQVNPALWSQLKVVIVLGTWCDDSRREVPRFFKALDINNIKPSEMEIICVDRKKKADGLTQNLGVTYVPVFIFYLNGVEIGRIVESPMETLEKDMFNLLKR